MTHQTPPCLDEPRLNTCQRPALCRFWQSQPSEEFTQVVGQDEQRESHLISHELMARKSCPVEGIFALLDPLLCCASAIVEFRYPYWWIAEVGDDEADSGKQFALVPLNFGNNSSRNIPILGLIGEVVIGDNVRWRRPFDRPYQQVRYIPLKYIVSWKPYSNWSDRSFVEKSAKQLAEANGIQSDRALALLTRAVKEARKLAGAPEFAEARLQSSESGLPVVEITNRQPREIEKDAWELLRVANEPAPEFFTLGSTVVHLERGPIGPYLHALTLPALRRHLKGLADFIRVSDKGEFPAVVPKTTLEDMMAMAQPPLPQIRQIINTPVLAPDGSILLTEGYSPDLGLYLALGAVAIPQVADIPLIGDVDRAKGLLLD